jgi:uncharacterized protein YndB with AHSA1/START domain
MSEMHELSVTRLIDAPRDLVWRIATERLAEWWCPRPWTTEIVELDWRAGGRSAMVMHGPEGEAHAQEGVFLEVVPQVRFVFTDAYAVGWVPQTPFMTGIFTVADEGGGTRYTASARHWSEAAKTQHAGMGFDAGWSAVAAQLAALAEAAR